MLDLLLSLAAKPSATDDDSGLPFPAGTPFKGVVPSANFINGTNLAGLIGLTAGTSINPNGGWLHFVEDNGYNVYIAKKPLRYGLTWESINAAQLGKEVQLLGKTFTVEFIPGMRFPNMSPALASGGGLWNRYMYNIYGGELQNALPNTKLNWGSYTEAMLGINSKAVTTPLPGSYTYVKETVNQTVGGAAGHATRGFDNPSTANIPNIMGVWWGGNIHNDNHYGWRPMLVEKGTEPPEPDGPFKGEIAQSAFITTAALRTAVGQVSGSAFSTDPWLKIVENGVTYYMAKKPLSNNMTRENLNTEGLVDGTKTVTIAGKVYKVRLVTGRDTSPSSTQGGEWLRWMTNLTNGTWAMYNSVDLNTGGGTGQTASFNHVWDKDNQNGTGWAISGYPGILGAWSQPINRATDPLYGWRPVLELVG